MAYFKRNKFSGIAPGVAPRLLAEQFGQEAENLDFESGRFAPLATEGTSVKTLANSIRRSIWYLDSDSAAPIWLEGTKKTSVLWKAQSPATLQIAFIGRANLTRACLRVR